jgi:hypothetical protein
MRMRYLVGPTAAVLGFAAIAADTAPALAGQAGARYSLSTGVYLQLPPQAKPWPRVTQVPIFGREKFTQTPCGGDFGMLGNVEAAQVAPANPMNAMVCD